jgi:hypothetical protein
MTKLEEEIGSVRKVVYGAGGFVRDNIDAAAPHWLIRIVRNIIEDDRTPWFMIGMSVEALGITVQFMLKMDAYPTLDFVFGGALAIGLLWYQGKRAEEENAE